MSPNSSTLSFVFLKSAMVYVPGVAGNSGERGSQIFHVKLQPRLRHTFAHPEYSHGLIVVVLVREGRTVEMSSGTSGGEGE